MLLIRKKQYCLLIQNHLLRQGLVCSQPTASDIMGPMEENLPVVKEDNKPAVVENCISCNEEIGAKELVYCSACRKAHHLKCWRKNRGCSIEECSCRISERPASEITWERDDEDKDDWHYADVDGSLVIDTHAYNIEDPFAGGIFLGCGGVIFGYFFSALAYSMGWYLTAASLVLFIIVSEGFRYRLRLNASGGAIERSLQFFGKEVSHDNSYLFLDELVELHLHTKEETEDDIEAEFEDDEEKIKKEQEKKKEKKTDRPAKFRYELYGVNYDGERRLMFARKTRNKPELERVVQQIAQSADVIIRRFNEGEKPSPKEIAEAVRQRRLEAPLSTDTKK